MYSNRPRSLDVEISPSGSLPCEDFAAVKSISFALASLRLMKEDLETQLRKVSMGKRTQASEKPPVTRSRLDRTQVLCQMTSDNNNQLYADFMDKSRLRSLAFQEQLPENVERDFYNNNMRVPPGLLCQEITPFEWQVLEKVIMVCLYHKKEMPMATLQQMLFQCDQRLELTFQLQFGSLNQFVKRHGRVFFIHRGSKNPEVSLKIDFVRQLLVARNGMAAQASVEEHSDMLIDEKMEKKIVHMAIQILFSHTAQNCTIGKLGQILHRRMNNPRLPRMFKHTYGGLKKFFERQNTCFEIKKDHLYNPIVTLNKDFRKLVEDQMANKENQENEAPVLTKLNESEQKPSPPRATNLMPTRPPLTSSTSENLMNLANQGPEPVTEWTVTKPSPLATNKTANWSLKVNEAQAALGEHDENAWLARLPNQLSQ